MAKPSTCSMPMCPNPVEARGWCNRHYRHWRVTGDPRFYPSGPKPLCRVDDCSLPARGDGLCSKHYQRWWKNGTVETVRQPPAPCSVDGCDKVSVKYKLCPMHWSRLRRWGTTDFISHRPKRPPCSIDGCMRGNWIEGMCRPHHREAYRESFRAADRRRYAERSPEEIEAERAWNRAHPEASRLAAHRRRARILGTQLCDITPAMLLAKAYYWGDRCWMCHGSWTDWDHVKPLSKGGAHMLCNLRPACRSCNASKNATWPLAKLT